MLIDAYRVQGEPLSTFQNASSAYMVTGIGLAMLSGGVGAGVWLNGLAGAMMPDGVGKDFWLAPQSTNVFARHSMGEVILSMKQMWMQ